MTAQNYLKALVNLKDFPDGLDVGDVVSYAEEFLSGTVLEPQDYIVARLLEGKDGAPVMAFLTRVDADMNPIPVPTVTRIDALSIGRVGFFQYTVQYSDGEAVDAGKTQIKMPVYPFYKGTPWLRPSPVPVPDAADAFHRSDGYAWFPTRVDLPPGTMPMTRDEALELRETLRAEQYDGDPNQPSPLTRRLILMSRENNEFSTTPSYPVGEWTPGEVDLDETMDFVRSSDDSRRVTEKKYSVVAVLLPAWMSTQEYIRPDVRMDLKYKWGGTDARPDWPESWTRALMEMSFERVYWLSKILKVQNFRSNFRKSLKEQMVRWFETPPSERRYGFPLSPRQYAAIEGPVHEPNRASDRLYATRGAWFVPEMDPITLDRASLAMIADGASIEDALAAKEQRKAEFIAAATAKLEQTGKAITSAIRDMGHTKLATALRKSFWVTAGGRSARMSADDAGIDVSLTLLNSGGITGEINGSMSFERVDEGAKTSVWAKGIIAAAKAQEISSLPLDERKKMLREREREATEKVVKALQDTGIATPAATRDALRFASRKDNPKIAGAGMEIERTLWFVRGTEPVMLKLSYGFVYGDRVRATLYDVKPDGTWDERKEIGTAPFDEIADKVVIALDGQRYTPLTREDKEAISALGADAPVEDRIKALLSTDPDAGRLIYFTDAEESYDGFGTRTVEIVGEGRKGRPIRKVSIDPDHETWQLTRYSSGLNFSVPEDQWEADKDLYLKKMQTFDAYVADKVAADPDASVAYANILADLVRQEEGGTPVIKRVGRDAVVELPEYGKSGPRSVRIDPVGGVTTDGVKPKGRVLNHYFAALAKELEARFADGLGKTFDFGTKDGTQYGPGTLLFFSGSHRGALLSTRFEEGQVRGDVWVSLSGHLPPGEVSDSGLGFEQGRNGKSYADPDLAVDIFAAKFGELITDPRWNEAVKTSGTSDKPVSKDAESPFSWDAHVNWLWTDPELSLKAYVGTDTVDNSLSWSVLGDWGSGHLDPQAGQVGVKMTSVEAVEKAATDAATVLGDFLAQLKPHDPRRQRLEQVWDKTDSDLRSEPGVTPRMITILSDFLPKDHPKFSVKMEPVVMELDELPDWTIARLLGEPIKIEPLDKKERAKWIRNRILERIRSKNLVKREELVSEYDVKRLGAKQPKREITAALNALKLEGLAAYNKRMGYRGWYDPRGEIMARANFDAALDMLASGEYDTAEDALGSYYDNMVDTFREEDTPKKVQEAAYSAWNRLVKDREIEERRRKAYGGTEPAPKLSWQQVTHRIPMMQGQPRDVSGEAKGTLMIHRGLADHNRREWAVTHWPTGMKVIAGHASTKKLAKAVVDALLDQLPQLATARTADELKADQREILRIGREILHPDRQANPARARRDRRVGGQWQLTPASLTDDHYERAETQLATEQAKRILADGVLLGEGNFGKVYWLDDPDHADVVLKVPRDRALYGHQQEWTPEQKRDNLLHEAGVANEIRELGSTIVPDTVFVELGGDTPALVREYGEPIEHLSPTDYAEVEAALMALEPHGWRVQDELLVMRRPDGSLFVADVGVWSHDEKVTLSELGSLLARWAESYGMDLRGATLPSLARDVESYESFAEFDEDGSFATMERRNLANALAKRREAGLPTPAEYARFESAE